MCVPVEVLLVAGAGCSGFAFGWVWRDMRIQEDMDYE